jgi:hypothetical protein
MACIDIELSRRPASVTASSVLILSISAQVSQSLNPQDLPGNGKTYSLHYWKFN